MTTSLPLTINVETCRFALFFALLFAPLKPGLER